MRLDILSGREARMCLAGAFISGGGAVAAEHLS